VRFLACQRSLWLHYLISIYIFVAADRQARVNNNKEPNGEKVAKYKISRQRKTINQ
jgi:hypothetical protein